MNLAIFYFEDKEIVCANEAVIEGLFGNVVETERYYIGEFVPLEVEDVQTKCASTRRVHVETKKLKDHELLQYHYAHSLCVSLLNDKRRQLKDLSKTFSEINYAEIDTDSLPEAQDMHSLYSPLLEHLWINKKLAVEIDSVIDEEDRLMVGALPAINQDMIKHIAETNICNASIKKLQEWEAYYEQIFETETTHIAHQNCYVIYLPDLDVCAVYNSKGQFIDFTEASPIERGSMNNLIFAGYRAGGVNI